MSMLKTLTINGYKHLKNGQVAFSTKGSRARYVTYKRLLNVP